jgi:PAS domain S-box-containing protein
MQRYDVADGDGNFTEKYWKVENRPVFGPDGEVAYFLHTTEDITARIKTEKRDVQTEGIKQAFDLFMHAPMVVGLVNGDAYVLELANKEAFKLWGKGPEIIGKPILQALPELEGQGIIELFDQVRNSGEPFFAHEVPVASYVNGKKEQHYFNLVYQPYYNYGSSKATGVFTISHDVTEQVKARQSAEESEAKFRRMAESTPVLIAVGDETSNATYLNEAWTELTGRPMEELLRFGWVDLVHPDDKEGYVKLYLDAFALKGPFTGEFRVLNPKGEYRWLLAHCVPRYTADGNFVGYISACTDITENKLGQQKLQTALEQVRLSKEAAELGTFDMDLERGTMHWDDRCRTLFGISHHNPVSYERDFAGGLHPDDRERILKVIDQLFTKSISNGDYDVEYRTVGAEDGVVRWVRAKGKVYFNAQEKPVRFIGSVLDITQKVLAIQKIETVVEERTRELEAQKGLLNNILTNSSNGISVTEMIRDESGNVIDARTVLANDAAVNYIGLPKELFLSKTAVELDPNILHSAYGQTCLNTLRTGEPALSQYYMELTGRWQELTISKMDDEHLIHIFTDVTPVKEAQLQLERTVEELRRSNRNLEEFAHAASHDLKEPVRKIHFFTTQLKEQLRTHLKEGELRLFGRIENATERMGNLIDDLLLYSHVSQRPPEMEKVDLNEKVQRVLEDLELDVQEKEAIISVGKLPVVQGYRRQLQQLFQNLISNALKYSKKDVAPCIVITAKEVVEKGKSYHLVTVEDNGIGFEQEYADKIFQMFTRLHGKGEYSGTGVGLSIVKKVVENHNGFIRVESTPGEGSTFNVLLPVE